MFEMLGLQADPAALDSDELLTAMSAAQRAINSLTAMQLQCAAEFARRRPAPEGVSPGGEQSRWGEVSEFASAEIATALTVSRWAADRLLDTALALQRLPQTAALLEAGELDVTRARILCGETAHLDDAEVGAVEQRVLARAPGQVPGELRRALRRAVAQVAPAAEQQRRADIVDERRTWTEHDGDGRSRFIAEGPTHDVLRLAAAVDAVGRTLDPGHAALGQRRFDALTSMADAILDDPRLPKTRFGPPGVVLLADVGTLSRLRDEQGGDEDLRHDGSGQAAQRSGTGRGQRPVELAGAGPIPDSLAVELLEAVHTVVVSFDASTRWPCDHDQGYQVPDRLARYLAGLHSRCVFPGCGVPVHRCDWDHAIPAPEGPTCACNLVPLCRYHHRLKTHTRWRIELLPGHRVRWTGPTGRSYLVHPDVDVGGQTAHRAA